MHLSVRPSTPHKQFFSFIFSVCWSRPIYFFISDALMILFLFFLLNNVLAQTERNFTFTIYHTSDSYPFLLSILSSFHSSLFLLVHGWVNGHKHNKQYDATFADYENFLLRVHKEINETHFVLALNTGSLTAVWILLFNRIIYYYLFWHRELDLVMQLMFQVNLFLIY